MSHSLIWIQSVAPCRIQNIWSPTSSHLSQASPPLIWTNPNITSQKIKIKRRKKYHNLYTNWFQWASLKLARFVWVSLHKFMGLDWSFQQRDPWNLPGEWPWPEKGLGMWWKDAQECSQATQVTQVLKISRDSSKSWAGAIKGAPLWKSCVWFVLCYNYFAFPRPAWLTSPNPSAQKKWTDSTSFTMTKQTCKKKQWLNGLNGLQWSMDEHTRRSPPAPSHWLPQNRHASDSGSRKLHKARAGRGKIK